MDLKEAGDPVENAVFYQAEGADELAMLDIAATLENRKTRLEWVKNVSAVLSIPLTVGGGIALIEDIELVLEAGASKVSMNRAAVKNPELVRQAAQKFGADKITVAIDAKRNKAMPSGFELVVSGGTLPVAKDAVAWAKTCQELGAGVILPTSMDGDGTKAGYDIEYTKAISSAVTLPVVASGGADSEGEECVESHAGRQRMGHNGENTHHEGPRCRGDDRSQENTLPRHACRRQDVWINEDDVHHGDESG